MLRISTVVWATTTYTLDKIVHIYRLFGNKYIFIPAVIVIYLKFIAPSNRSTFLSLPVPIKNAFRFSFSICFRSRNVSHPSSSAKKRKLRVAFTFRVFPCTEGITLLSLYYSVICLENNVIIFRTAIG
jgi:hypothetical protein